jgi:hypothetical protein
MDSVLLPDRPEPCMRLGLSGYLPFESDSYRARADARSNNQLGIEEGLPLSEEGTAVVSAVMRHPERYRHVTELTCHLYEDASNVAHVLPCRGMGVGISAV